ncbi:MAG: BrnA antitoxin family protein [Caulobacterales bacterium]
MKQRSVRVTGAEPLTETQRQEIADLAGRPESEIDYSDIPPLDDDFWKRAMRNPFYRPLKAQLTVRLDNDVLAWLKAQGRGYQTRINAILRRAMLEDVSSK